MIPSRVMPRESILDRQENGYQMSKAPEEADKLLAERGDAASKDTYD
jgi:hypothetical protein